MPSAEAPSSKKQRDDRAQQRGAVREQAQHKQSLRDQARRDQALLDETRRKESAAAELSRQKALRANMQVSSLTTHVQKLMRRFSTSLNAVNSPLLRLPAELRNIIYDYVFVDAYLIEQRDRGPIYVDIPLLCVRVPVSNVLGLLLASRQLHCETALLLYKLSTFQFDLDVPHDTSEDDASTYSGYGDEGDVDYDVVKEFLCDRSAEQLKAITKMELCTFDVDVVISFEIGTGEEWTKKLLG